MFIRSYFFVSALVFLSPSFSLEGNFSENVLQFPIHLRNDRTCLKFLSSPLLSPIPITTNRWVHHPVDSSVCTFRTHQQVLSRSATHTLGLWWCLHWKCTGSRAVGSSNDQAKAMIGCTLRCPTTRVTCVVHEKEKQFSGRVRL